MIEKPYQSSLIPYKDEIIALRRKRPPVPYSQIAATLNEKYQLKIGTMAVFDFFKRQVTKKPRQYKYDAWDIELSEEQKQPEALSVQKATALKPYVQEEPKQEETAIVLKSYVQEKPKQEEDEEFDIDEIIRELDNHKLEYHDLASGYKPKFYPPKIAAAIRQRLKEREEEK